MKKLFTSKLKVALLALIAVIGIVSAITPASAETVTSAIWRRAGNQMYTVPAGQTINVGACNGCGGGMAGQIEIGTTEVMGGGVNQILYTDPNSMVGSTGVFTYNEDNGLFRLRGAIPTVTAPSFTGTGVDDMTTGGTYNGAGNTNYTVTISAENVAYIINISNVVGTCGVNETVTGGTSGESAVYKLTDASTWYLTGLTDPFTPGETLTCVGSGATAEFGGDNGRADQLSVSDGVISNSAYILGSGNQMAGDGATFTFATTGNHTMGDSWDFVGDYTSYNSIVANTNGGTTVIGDRAAMTVSEPTIAGFPDIDLHIGAGINLNSSDYNGFLSIFDEPTNTDFKWLDGVISDGTSTQGLWGIYDPATGEGSKVNITSSAVGIQSLFGVNNSNLVVQNGNVSMLDTDGTDTAQLNVQSGAGGGAELVYSISGGASSGLNVSGVGVDASFDNGAGIVSSSTLSDSLAGISILTASETSQLQIDPTYSKVEYVTASSTAAVRAASADIEISASNGTDTAGVTYEIDGDTVGTGRTWGVKGGDINSANNMTLGKDGSYFRIVGNTQLNCVASAGWQLGQEVKYRFQTSLTVADSQLCGAGFLPYILAGSANFSATADDIIVFIVDNDSFIEQSRSAN